MKLNKLITIADLTDVIYNLSYDHFEESNFKPKHRLEFIVHFNYLIDDEIITQFDLNDIPKPFVLNFKIDEMFSFGDFNVYIIDMIYDAFINEAKNQDLFISLDDNIYLLFFDVKVR